MANLTPPMAAMALQNFIKANTKEFENFIDTMYPECAKSQVDWEKDPQNKRLVLRITKVSTQDYKPLTERRFFISLEMN